MKKYIVLMVFTILMAFSIGLTGSYIKSLVVEVDVIKIKAMYVDDSIVCLGKVELEKTENIFLEQSCVVRKVYVREGDNVEEGQVIFDVVKLNDKKLPSALKPSVNGSDSQKLPGISDTEDMESAYRRLLEAQKSEELKPESGNFFSSDASNGVIEKIKSPISGILSSLYVKEGQVIPQENSMACVADSSNVQVRLRVSENQISQVKNKQPVTITGVGFKNISYTGSIESIASQAQRNSEALGLDVSVDVIASVKDSDENLKPGFTAKCEILIPEDTESLVVPYNCVGAEDDGREFVYVCKNKKVQKTYIETKKEFPNGFEVSQGICEGDTIIVEPNFIDNKSIIKIKNT
ncbi:MAG: efflux RND transporter periplasmic adaptor subunit [Oscillospiraceae bacterium]|jgi:multidrug efflux pump subunit AcrA (membrane-fusion protein)|nr:efflux RND transporter periplasmic adaptor subunit [Oscillospiraceae bacterium]